MTAEPTIDYEGLAQEAMRGVVRTVLTATAKTGLAGDHHFYISFDTEAPGVTLSKRLKEKYPREMTIVLQHRFWDLAVTDERFEVKLTFDGIPERLVVPVRGHQGLLRPLGALRLAVRGSERGVRRALASADLRQHDGARGYTPARPDPQVSRTARGPRAVQGCAPGPARGRWRWRRSLLGGAPIPAVKPQGPAPVVAINAADGEGEKRDEAGSGHGDRTAIRRRRDRQPRQIPQEIGSPFVLA